MTAPQYHEVVHFAQTWGLGSMVAVFFAAVAYACWPRNKQEFERAARAPLDDDENGG